MASRFTAKDLREIVDNLNELYPLPQPSGYGDTERFYLSRAYDGFEVQMAIVGSTGRRDVTLGHKTPMHTAARLCEWLAENTPRLVSGEI